MHTGEVWEHLSTWHRFNVGNNEYQLDMWMKVYEVQTSSYYFGDEAGVDAFLDPYAPVLNWRLQDDTTGSQNIHSGASSRYKSFGTTNPAKDIWFTFTGCTYLRCYATKVYYRRSDVSLAASYQASIDNIWMGTSYTVWNLPNAYSITAYGDEIASYKGKVICTIGSDWAYQSATGGTVSVNGNTATTTVDAYGTAATATFWEGYLASNLQVKPKAYYGSPICWHEQHDGNLPYGCQFCVHVYTPQTESGGDWSVKLWRYAGSTYYEKQTLYLYDTGTGDTGTTYIGSSYGWVKPSAPMTDRLYTQGLYLGKYTAIVAYDGAYVQTPSQYSVGGNPGHQGQILWDDPAAGASTNVDWMFSANGVQMEYQMDGGGTVYTVTSPYTFTDIGGSTFRTYSYFSFYSQIPNWGVAWEGHYLYYRFKYVVFAGELFTYSL
jgi:hypothetical protein